MELSNKKINFKGDPSELHAFIMDNEIDPKEIFDVNEFKVSEKKFLTSVLIYSIASCLIWYFNDDLINYQGIEFIVLLVLGGSVVICCYRCYRNTLVTLISGSLSIIALLVSMHWITPEEASREVKEKVNIVVDKKIETATE